MRVAQPAFQPGPFSFTDWELKIAFSAGPPEVLEVQHGLAQDRGGSQAVPILHGDEEVLVCDAMPHLCCGHHGVPKPHTYRADQSISQSLGSQVLRASRFGSLRTGSEGRTTSLRYTGANLTSEQYRRRKRSLFCALYCAHRHLRQTTQQRFQVFSSENVSYQVVS